MNYHTNIVNFLGHLFGRGAGRLFRKSYFFREALIREWALIRSVYGMPVLVLFCLKVGCLTVYILPIGEVFRVKYTGVLSFEMKQQRGALRVYFFEHVSGLRCHFCPPNLE